MSAAAPPLRILVVDDHSIVGDAVEQIVNARRFGHWLGSARPPEVKRERFALSAVGEYPERVLAGYDAIVVDLRLPKHPREGVDLGEPSDERPERRALHESIDRLCKKKYNGFRSLAYLSSHVRSRFLRRTVVHSANVENVQEEFVGLTGEAAVDVPGVFSHFTQLGLTVCEKGRPAAVELEIHLFSLLHLAVSCQVVDPETRWNLLQVAHRGLRRGHISHALIAGPMGSGAFVAKHLHALTGHYADIMREEAAFRTVETDLTREEVPRLSPALTTLRSFGPEGQVSLTDLHGQLGADGSARYGVLVAPIVSDQLAAVQKAPSGIVSPIQVSATDVFCDVFIEELSDVPPRAQTSFVGLLEEGELRPVHADWSHILSDERGTLHFRLIAATTLIEPKDADTLPEGLPWSVAAIAAPAPRVLRSELWYRMGLPKIRIPSLTREDVVEAVILIHRSLPNARGYTPERDIINLFADVVESQLCPGGLLQLRGLVEEAYFAAEERAAHPAFGQPRSPSVHLADLPLAREDLMTLRYFLLARRLNSWRTRADREVELDQATQDVVDVCWLLLAQALGPTKFGRWLEHSPQSVSKAVGKKEEITTYNLDVIKAHINGVEELAVPRSDMIDVLVVWCVWKEQELRAQTDPGDEAGSFADWVEWVEADYRPLYQEVSASRITIRQRGSVQSGQPSGIDKAQKSSGRSPTMKRPSR